jgi:hypothetical protein
MKMKTATDQHHEDVSPHYEQQQELPSEKHTAHEKQAEHEAAQTHHGDGSENHGRV